MFFHMTKGYDKHQHETVAQARECEEEILAAEFLAKAETEAEMAIERYYETNMDLAEETLYELAMEAAWL